MRVARSGTSVKEEGAVNQYLKVFGKLFSNFFTRSHRTHNSARNGIAQTFWAAHGIY